MVDMDGARVALGDSVILRAANGSIKTQVIKDKGSISLFKLGSFPASILIGKLYGATYELLADNKTLRLKRDLPITTEDDADDGTATNENISQSRLDVQGLSAEDIANLKEAGVDGRTIIAKQIQEHAAFELKNQHSKAKYIARKESKYLKHFTIIQPTIHNLCNLEFMAKATSPNLPSKIRELRPDTLGQMLLMANVEPSARILCVEETSGLLPGAILSRLGGSGSLLILNDADSPPAHPLLPLYNLSKASLKPLSYLNWAHASQDYQPLEVVPPLPPSPTASTSNLSPTADGPSNDKAKRKANKRKEVLNQVERRRQLLFQAEWDALIICSTYDSSSIVDFLQPYLAGSANLVVHSLFLEPLTILQQHLRSTAHWTATNITEAVMRKYQVLPGRTHPEMNGVGPAGFLLHAIHILDSDEDSQPHNKRRKKSASHGAAAQQEGNHVHATLPEKNDANAMKNEA